jgi:hypothetical protein
MAQSTIEDAVQAATFVLLHDVFTVPGAVKFVLPPVGIQR